MSWIGVSACSSWAVDPLCPQASVTFPANYTGDAAGHGLVELIPHREGEIEVTLQIQQMTGSDEATLKLHGFGKCAAGRIWARFGGSAPNSAPVRILGAAVEALYQPTLLETEIVGAWSAQIVQKPSGTPATAVGYFRQAKSASTEQANEPTARSRVPLQSQITGSYATDTAR